MSTRLLIASRALRIVLRSDSGAICQRAFERALFEQSQPVIADEVISIGTVNANVIHAREVFPSCHREECCCCILAHNHPSGEVTPSDEDIAITKQLVQAGKILGIRVLDHVIITKDAFASVSAEY